MKKFLFIFIFSTLFSNAYGKAFNHSESIWSQYQSLMCTKIKDKSCTLDVCKTTNSNVSFELDFQNNEMRYFTKYDLKYKILERKFHSKDSVYKKPVHTLAISAFTIQLFNFEGKKSYGKPEFISVQTQVGLLPETESDITTITSFAKCYPK